MREPFHKKEHTPIGHDETPELPAAPHGAPEHASIGSAAGRDRRGPPPDARERSAPVGPAIDRRVPLPRPPSGRIRFDHE